MLAPLALCLGLVTACTAATGEPIALSADPVALVPGDDGTERVGRLEFRGGLHLRSLDSRFGGLSGLEIDADGGRMIAVSDRGWWVTAALEYGRDGDLVGAGDAAMWPLLGPDEESVAGTRLGDAEALRRDESGALLVSFEQRHRIWRYPGDTGLDEARPKRVPVPTGIRNAPANGGIEALAVLPESGLLAIAERLTAREGLLQGWVFDESAAVPVLYTFEDDFRPTDMTTLPGGGILVIERRFVPPASVSGRFRRFGPDRLAAGRVIDPEEVARLERPAIVDNYEGIAARRSATGEIFVYVISDDNYNLLQRTLLLMFALVE